MVDFTSTQAQAKELAPPASQGEAQNEATATKHLSASPALTANEVDMMYHQVVEIHAITAAQLVECAHRRRTGSTPRLTRSGASRSRPSTGPSATRLAPSPHTDFSS
jgi:histidine ammonia-lyase